MTKPIYSTDDAIIEDLFVETTIDSDNDGERDRVAIRATLLILSRELRFLSFTR